MIGCAQSVRDFIKSEYGTIERKIVTVVDGKTFGGKIAAQLGLSGCDATCHKNRLS